MPVSARIIRDGTIPAAGALVDVAAERGATTANNGVQDLQMLPGEPFLAAFIKAFSCCADQAGHLQADAWRSSDAACGDAAACLHHIVWRPHDRHAKQPSPRSEYRLCDKFRRGTATPPVYGANGDSAVA